MSWQAYTRCSYCGRRAQCRDHVVPKSLWVTVSAVRWPCDLTGTVPACNDCNMRKGTRALLPPSWAPRIAALSELFPSRAWRVWDGDSHSPAYTETHLSPPDPAKAEKEE